MSYPIEIQRLALSHVGGTKFYNMTIASNLDGKSIVIYRYGRVNTFGEMIVEKHETKLAAENSLEKKLREKTSGRKGYKVDRNDSFMSQDEGELRGAVTPMVWAKLGPDAVRHLDANAETTGRRETPDPRFDEDGNFLGNPQPKKIEITEDMRKAEANERQKAMINSNADWGRF